MPDAQRIFSRPDVLVIGGGSAGIGAALAAARQGGEVLLVEAGGYLGGAGTASLVHSFCGLYELPAHEKAAVKMAHRGLPAELERLTRAEGIAHGPRRMGRVDVLMHSPPLLAGFFDRWCAAEPSMRVLLHTQVIAAETDGDRVISLRLHCRGRELVVEPRAVVDASGDAVLAPLCGHPFEIAASGDLLRPAYCVGLADVEPFDALVLAGVMAQGIQKGALPTDAGGAQFRCIAEHGEAYLTLDLPGESNYQTYDSTDPASLSEVEKRGREVVSSIVKHLRREHEPFERARVCSLPARAGIRESRRWIGEQVLTEEDILSSRQQELDVAVSTWPMEVRETARGPRLLFPREPRGCGIPLGCLRARELRNVFTAGRCISTTHRAQASTRVMGTALATGQAAGLAASLPAASSHELATHVSELLAAMPS
jgi:hypothetical protein